MPIAIDETRLTTIIKQAVHEAVEEEFNSKFMELMLRLIPTATEDEQREVEEMFGKEPGEHDVARVIILERK
jgi:hypothetical protein